MKRKHRIIGVHVTDRAKDAIRVQSILTEHGCNIRTRLGLHDAGETHCSPGGVLLLEVVGDDGACDALAAKLAGLEGVEVKRMEFDHQD
ncbi:MAG: hypothetical protein JW958_06195 [Candidatus Eisenbacteria bacterium]|nr:hypothetical protein [Candidatus Eisenbacteria bacterium]